MHRLLNTAILVCLLPGCAWNVRAPDNIKDPVDVWISEYGRHCRVAVPSGRSTFIEYGFGEWNFYGREKRDILSMLRAGTGLGSGAFSRRELIPARDGTLGPRQTGGTRSEALHVERSRAESLRAELDARWQANQHTVRTRAIDGVVVSRDPTRYHVFRNSNHTSAGWLEQLGCEVRGFPLFSNFRIER